MMTRSGHLKKLPCDPVTNLRPLSRLAVKEKLMAALLHLADLLPGHTQLLLELRVVWPQLLQVLNGLKPSAEPALPLSALLQAPPRRGVEEVADVPQPKHTLLHNINILTTGFTPKTLNL